MEHMHGKYIPLEAGTVERILDTSITHLGSKLHDTHVHTIPDLLSITSPS